LCTQKGEERKGLWGGKGGKTGGAIVKVRQKVLLLVEFRQSSMVKGKRGWKSYQIVKHKRGREKGKGKEKRGKEKGRKDLKELIFLRLST